MIPLHSLISLWLWFTPSLVLAQSAPVATEATTYQVNHIISADNKRRWRSAFDVRATQHLVTVTVTVKLIPIDVRQVKVDKIKHAWRSSIEQVWSKQFALKIGSAPPVPIHVAVNFIGPVFNHRVRVRSTTPVSDQLNWSIRASPQSIAHEFGHMLGAFDEYAGGGLHPTRPILDKQSIMTSRPRTGQARARHFWLIRDTIAQQLGREDVTIVVLNKEQSQNTYSF